jgi:hypothetical protein
MDPNVPRRPTAQEHYQNIQDKTMAKLKPMWDNNLAMAQEQAMGNIGAQRVSRGCDPSLVFDVWVVENMLTVLEE